MDYEDEEKWSRKDLIFRLKLTEAMNESFIEVIKLTCKEVSGDEAYAWGNFFQFNSRFYLHPIPYKGTMN